MHKVPDSGGLELEVVERTVTADDLVARLPSGTRSVSVFLVNRRTPDEDNPRGYYEFEAVKQVKADPSWLAAAGGKVVKMVYRLLYDLPNTCNYRVVFMKRRLEEVIASQEEMLRRYAQEL